MQKVIVWDPEGDGLDGELLSDAHAAQLEARGGIALPVGDGKLIATVGCGAYAKRQFGKGWPISGAMPQHHAPVTLFVREDQRRLHWAARLVAEDGWDPKFALGTITVTAGPNHIGGYRGSVTPGGPPILVAALGSPDGPLGQGGGWIVRGHGQFHPPRDGYYELALYGTARAMRIAWFAASVH